MQQNHAVCGELAHYSSELFNCYCWWTQWREILIALVYCTFIFSQWGSSRVCWNWIS